MRLREYVQKRIEAGERRKDVIAQLAKIAKVSTFTVKNAVAGACIAKYETAKLIADVCGVDGIGKGESVVTIRELCEPS
jgi:2,3-bisphosphoglycerate-independent phosphoglycerate mutase